MRFADRLFAHWYPRMMGVSERAGQAGVRAAHLRQAHGRTLEIGAGSGLSLPHYTPAVTELVLLEPDPCFRAQLASALRDAPPSTGPWRIVDGDAHALPFPDQSFDAVTTSFTLCSVHDVPGVLAEVHRVLRPGGCLLFHEHVRGGRWRARLQDAMTPIQVALAGGCHPNRDIAAMLRASPLQITDITAGRMPRGSPTVAPVIHGTAIR